MKKLTRKRALQALARLARSYKRGADAQPGYPGAAVVLDGERAYASDGAVWLSTRCPQNIDGLCVIDEPLLRALLKQDEDIVIDVDRGQVNELSLSLPQFGQELALPPLRRPLAEFDLSLDRLKAVLVAAAVNDIRYYLNGVCFDFARQALVGTDGHRLHAFNSSTLPALPDGVEGSVSPVMPRKAAELMVQLELAHVTWDGVGFIASCGETELRVAAIDSSFPDYAKVLRAASPAEVTVSFDLTPLRDALRTACALGKARKAAYVGVVLDSATADLAVHVGGEQIALPNALRPRELSGVLHPIAFTPDYLLNAVEQLTPTARWRFLNSKTHPVASSLNIDDGDFKVVVMPMNL